MRRKLKSYYKGKSNALQCGNYMGIRLLRHSIEAWEKILDKRLKQTVQITKCQFGFMSIK